MRSLVKPFMFLALIVLGATGVWAQNNTTIDLLTVTSDITVNNGYTLTGTLSANKKISIASGATVTLNNVTINGVDNGSYNWAGITCNGNATIILVGENTVKGFYSYRSGIFVPANSTLTIQGSGSLTASSNGNGAGIGSNTGSSGGNINIAGGTITATGGDRCAGIGGCGGGSCGNINITGGMVTATGGNSAPGIGGGQGSSCGSITIANTVTGIRAVKGGGSAQASYSIGAGYGGSCGTVTVNGNVSNGIMTNPYSYPSYTLDDIPPGWTVKADNQTVSVTDGVASIPVGATVMLTPPTPDKPRVKDVELLSPEEIPLTFEAKTAGSMVVFTEGENTTLNPLLYSINGGNWAEYTFGDTITLADSAAKVSFRGTNAAYALYSEGDGASHFSCTADCYVYGNIMSLIDSVNFATTTALTSDNTFCSLFINNSHIYNHATKSLELPAMILKEYCYASMFKGCTNLTSAPALPAMTMANLCYLNMFQGCTSLTTAPALPATSLAEQCYEGMFSGCTSLTTAPILPAQTLIHGCYSHMFNGCSLLSSVTSLATDISAQYCTTNWLLDVAQTGTFVKPASMDEWDIDNPSGIPEGWTVKDYETFLPLTFEAKTANATVTFTKATSLSSLSIEYSLNGGAWTVYTQPISLADSGDKVSFRGTNMQYSDGINHSTFSCNDCYFYGNILSLINKDNYPTITSMNYDNSRNHTFNSLFGQQDNGVYNHPSKELLLPATDLTPSCYSAMFEGCTHLTSAPALPATNLAFRCYDNMFHGCTGLISAPVLPATNLSTACYSAMFEGCTHLTSAPALPATNLSDACYYRMFAGCTSLTTAPELPASTLTNYCYANMFQGCTSLTTAPELPATTLAEECYYHMFESCTHLNQVTCLATDISAQHCIENWLNNVAATGTFIKPASMNDWTLNSPDGIPVGWTAIPVVPGKFSVNADGDQIYFSQGNLQATTSDHGANWTWSFATNQWDYIGNAEANTSINGDGTVSTNGTVDLFGWVGASSTWTGAAQYGISNATTTNSTYTYGNVADEALKSDWGNNIDSSWRTLTIDKWQYLFNTRASGSTVNGTSNARYTHATINGVNGIILFPDGVTIASGEATQWGAINGTSAWGTQCTSDQWTALAAKGCVFLPAAGDRFNGTSISSAGDQGLYWSSTSYTTDSNPAYCIKFGSNSLITNESYYRLYGLSVRLVRDAN